MSSLRTRNNRVVALCGGVGGAKLAYGLARILRSDLTVIVNTGDDFEHLGLMISPDIDTVIYTLGRRADRERGWGRTGESWRFMEALDELGGETWFRLGDLDLAMHVLRTRDRQAGRSLTAITTEIAERFGIAATILPVSDHPVRTIVETPDGDLPFQRYFVEQRCIPRVTGVRLECAANTDTTAQVRRAFGAPGLRGVVICPSNPYLSIDPILAVPGMLALLKVTMVPIVAVSPIIGGAAVKGPTTKIMKELELPATQHSIFQHYAGLIDGLVIDEADRAERGLTGVAVKVTRTLMEDEVDREQLAHDVLQFIDEIAGEAKAP